MRTGWDDLRGRAARHWQPLARWPRVIATTPAGGSVYMVQTSADGRLPLLDRDPGQWTAATQS